jgi:hypothetical protein
MNLSISTYLSVANAIKLRCQIRTFTEIGRYCSSRFVGSQGAPERKIFFLRVRDERERVVKDVLLSIEPALIHRYNSQIECQCLSSS